jgi:hypothetical protein
MTAPDLVRAKWRKSTRSNHSGNCVEVAFPSGQVAVRDSKNPAGQALVFSPASWSALVNGAKHGTFDLN